MKDKIECFHFRGIQKPCAVGIDPKTVRDASSPGPYRWPCLTLPGYPAATTTCAQFRAYTAEELAAEKAELQALLARAAERERSGQCIHCGKDVTRTRRVGSCIYADPCGHRQGQAAEPEFMP